MAAVIEEVAAMDCMVKAVVAIEEKVVATKEGVAIHRVKAAATTEEAVAAIEVVSIREEVAIGEGVSAAATSDSPSKP